MESIVELRQLRHFVTLAQSRNFSQAAENLYIAQPALSISIRNLEDEIGARLFDRGPRQVTLTDAGRVALVSARSALLHVDEMTRLVGTVRTGASGLLRIAFVGSATFSILPSCLPEFRQRYPAVELELTEGTTVEVMDRVRSGAADAGIVRYPVLLPSGLKKIVLDQDSLVAVLPARHPLAAKAKLRLRELTQQPFIQYSQVYAPSMNAVVTLACQSAGFEPRIAQEAIQIQTIVSLVESGLGVALVPRSCEGLLGQNVSYRPISDHGSQLSVGLALVCSPAQTGPLLQNFIEVLANRQGLVAPSA